LIRIAIVHERFTEVGGSELVVRELLRLYPDATLFAPIAGPAGMPPGVDFDRVVTGPLQRLYRPGGGYAHLLPLLARAMAATPLGGFDLVITSHHAFAHRVRPAAGVPWVSYVHTPARWMWDPGTRANEGGRAGRAGLGALVSALRSGDVRAAQRVDRLVVNSTAVAERVAWHWGRASSVVHPPVDVEWFTPDSTVPREGFFLLAGRLVPYKRPEVAVAAAREAGVRLVVVGEGRARAGLESGAGGDVEFLGRVDDATLRDLYRRCRALVFPGEEDFGIVPVEAMACGAPVLALDAGGVRDSVLDGVTGRLVTTEPTTADQVRRFAQAIEAFDPADFDAAAIAAHAAGFGRAAFAAGFLRQVDALFGERLDALAGQRREMAAVAPGPPATGPEAG